MAVATLGWRSAWAVLLDVVIPAGAVLAVRGARMAVVVDGWGVTVRGLLWTRRYPWKEVRGFEAPGSGLLPWVLPRMLCSSGRRIRLWPLLVGRGDVVWGGLWGDDWVDEQLAGLRRDLWKHRRLTG